MELSPDITFQNTFYMSGTEIKQNSNLTARQNSLEGFDFVSNLLSDFSGRISFFYKILRAAFIRTTMVSCEMISMFKNNLLAAIWAYFCPLVSISWVFIPCIMERAMLLMRKDYKVFKTVIRFYAINMMDLFVFYKRSAKMFGHNQSTSLYPSILTCIGVVMFCDIKIAIFHNKYPFLFRCTYDSNMGQINCQVGGPI